MPKDYSSTKSAARRERISNEELQKEICELVKNEVANWEESISFVTEKVAFRIKDLIRTLRRNYWGVFDNPVDPNTGRKKIWTHLTKYIVESVVKNIDLDTKDINFRAKHPGATANTMILRNAVKNELDRMFFGETMDMLWRTKAIDGTGILKTWEEDGHVKTRIVDRLNFYIDPTANSIQEAPATIERVVMRADELSSMDIINKDKIKGQNDVARHDGERLNLTSYRGEQKFVEVFERWGYFPKYYITGKKSDTDATFGKIWATRDGSNWVYNKCEEVDGDLKPYEEDWYTRVANRWDGEGAAEKVMWEQLYVNIVRNVRINRSYVSQLGLFKLRRGSGITPQMLSRLSANGIIPVNNMDDIEQFVVQEASQASYNDEINSESWAKKVTSAFETVTGESLPASTTATTSAITQQGAMSQFTLIKEGSGMFLQRWINRHVLPIVIKNLKVGDVIRCSADYTNYEESVRTIAENRVIKRYEESGLEIPALNELNVQIEMEASELKKNTKELFITLEKQLKTGDYDTLVYVTNEDVDKSVIVNNLIQALPLAPEYREQIVKQIFDLYGLQLNPIQKLPIQRSMVEGMQGVSQTPPATTQGLTTEAMTGNNLMV